MLRRPRRRASVACDECAIAAGNSCSAPQDVLPAFAGSVFIEAGAINVSDVPQSGPSIGGSLRLHPAMSGHSPTAASR